MPLKKGHSKEIISNNIKEMVRNGHSQAQAIAASLHNADKYNMGGSITDNDHIFMNDDMGPGEQTPKSGAGNNKFANLKKKLSSYKK